MEQRTDEWFAARLGKITSSRVRAILGTAKNRAKCMDEVIAELKTGQRVEQFINDAMVWGTETEPMARDAYSASKGILVEEVGFITHPTINRAGASPDGLIGDDGLVEIKCPMPHTHQSYLLSKKIPEKYIIQMQWQMACTKRKWCDWLSFDPRAELEDQMLIIRVERDDGFIKNCEKHVLDFLTELDSRLEIIKELESEKF